MKRILFGIAALAALTGGSAFAADLPPAPPPPAYKAPAYVEPIYSWSGFYIGGDLGGGWANQSATTTPFPSPGFGAPAIGGAGIAGFGNLPTSHNLNGGSVLGGVYAGFNWQIAPSFLLGVEGDYTALGRSVTNTQTVFETFSAPPAAPAFNMAYSASNRYLASARARAGAIFGSWMVYATGGAAWTTTNYTATASGITAGPVTLAGVGTSTSWSDTRTGWVAGGGVEWMVAPHWLVRAEYLHYGFGSSSAVLPLIVTAGVAGATCTPGACNWALNSSRLDFDTARVGISYKFGGPVYARD